MRRRTYGHPRMFLLAARLGGPRYHAVGLVEELDQLALRRGGGAMTAHDIAILAATAGFDGDLAGLLAETGWLVPDDTGWRYVATARTTSPRARPERTVVVAPAPAPAQAQTTLALVAPPAPNDAEFGRFWAAYPIRRDRKKSREIWRVKRLDRLIDVILASIERQRTTRAWADGYVQHPSRWLRDERWNDETTARSAAVAADPARDERLRALRTWENTDA